MEIPRHTKWITSEDLFLSILNMKQSIYPICSTKQSVSSFLFVLLLLCYTVEHFYHWLSLNFLLCTQLQKIVYVLWFGFFWDTSLHITTRIENRSITLFEQRTLGVNSSLGHSSPLWFNLFVTTKWRNQYKYRTVSFCLSLCHIDSKLVDRYCALISKAPRERSKSPPKMIVSKIFLFMYHIQMMHFEKTYVRTVYYCCR